MFQRPPRRSPPGRKAWVAQRILAGVEAKDQEERKDLMPNVAVLTNDLQDELVNEFVEKFDYGADFVAQAIPPFTRFLDAIRSLGHVVAHCQLIHDADDPQVQRRYRHRNIPVIRGTPGTAVIKEFVHPSDLIVEKSRDSGFYETVLDDKLQELGVKTVLVTGISTQVCVQTTAA